MLLFHIETITISGIWLWVPDLTYFLGIEHWVPPIFGG